MSTTPAATTLRPFPGPRLAWLPVALVFVVGTSIGAVASASLIHPTEVVSAPSGPTAPDTELTRLLGNMDAAAQRGDVRLFIGFREDLAQLIASTDIAAYQALRSIDTAGE